MKPDKREKQSQKPQDPEKRGNGQERKQNILPIWQKEEQHKKRSNKQTNHL
jgi:hypothetical protein